MILKIIKYESRYENIWDNFVKNAILGTIYHTRKFINYHPKDRFQDESILIYKNNLLICVMPCCKCNNKYFSYSGSTFGGPIFSKVVYKYNYLVNIINEIIKYYDNKIEFRIANDIYFNESSFILYFLLKRKLDMKLELSWYIDVKLNFLENIKNKNRKRALKKNIEKIQCLLTNKNKDYIEFHSVLSNTLKKKHNNIPTHNINELIELKNILNDKQLLHIVKNNNTIVAGIFTIKVTDKCWYTVYMTRNLDVYNSGEYIAIILNDLVNLGKKEKIDYIDLGITTENSGNLINEGLTIYKEESLGAKSNYRYLFTID